MSRNDRRHGGTTTPHRSNTKPLEIFWVVPDRFVRSRPLGVLDQAAVKLVVTKGCAVADNGQMPPRPCQSHVRPSGIGQKTDLSTSIRSHEANKHRFLFILPQPVLPSQQHLSRVLRLPVEIPLKPARISRKRSHVDA